MISPWKRVFVTACVLVAALVVAGVYRMLLSHGVFTGVEPGYNGVHACQAVASPAGPEDMVIDQASQTVFLSATDRRAMKIGKPSPTDGIYAYAYLQPGAKPQKLAGAPADFHPHGISLYRAPDGKLTLFVINHRAKGGSDIVTFVVSFAQSQIRLSETGIVSSDQLVSPNAIAAMDETRFYVVNARTSKSDLGHWLDDNLVLPRANAFYFDGMRFTLAADGLNYPNGVAVSKDGRYVYIAQSFARRLSTFERDPFRGVLKEVSALDIPSNLDDLHFDAQGNLWLGSSPKTYALAAYRTDASKPSPSVVYRVALKDGIPQDYAQVLADMGGKIGASSTASFAAGHLLVGSSYDTKILNCLANE